MKKVSRVVLRVFSVGILMSLFAGALSLAGFVVSMFVGGELATEICVFIHQTYFPYVIRFTSVFVAFGLVGMYLSKIKALTLSGNRFAKKNDK